MTKISRREFIKTSTKTAVAASTLWGTRQSWAGANDRVRIAVVGIRGMGFSHIKNYAQLDNVEVAALVDVDENLLPERLQWLADNGKPKPQVFVDMRDMLADKNIDAVSVATQNHWHALAGYWAVQAGKHATLEKPGTHNIFEGRQLVKAARKYGKMIQHHAERRTFQGFQSAMNFLHSGGLGEVYMAKGICYKWRDTIGKAADAPVPPGVHYDLWLGPAPKRPFNPNRFHYNWHWHWDYGNGDLGNQGAHQMDIARWGLDVKHPTAVTSVGGHFMFDDDQETPNTQMALFEFPNPKGRGDKKKILQFEVRHWISNHEAGLGSGGSNAIGNLFFGSEGYMVISLGGEWKTYLGKERQPGPSGSGKGNMFQNYVDAIRAEDKSILAGDIEEGHYSCSLIHLANIAYRLGRRLDFDPENERFIADSEADRMLSRNYREPFIIPETV
jgi:predicted dehydrogenase